jgi:glycine/D-amino acid oxidase-like deaminating enzyme
LHAASGARVIENSEVRAIEQEGAAVIVRSRRATVTCRQAVLATNAYSRLVHPFFKDQVQPVRAQAYATEPAGFRLLDGPTGTNDGFEYFRQLPDTRFIIGGYRDVFADEEVGYADETTEHLQAGLQAWLGAYFPELAALRITHRWSGVMGFTASSLPLTGRLPDLPNVYYCVGFNGGGMSMGPVAARRVVELMSRL